MNLRSYSGSLFGILLLSSCGGQIEHTNPFDPSTPQSLQAKVSLTGQVTLEAESDFSGTIVGLKNTSIQTQTNPDGTFTLTGIPAGLYDLLISRASYQSQTVPALNFPLGTSAAQSIGAVALLLKRTPVAGTVVLQGQSVSSGALVTLARTGRPSGAPPEALGSGVSGRAASAPTGAVTLSTLSDGNGGYLFLDVPAGTYDLTITKDQFSPANQTGIDVSGDASVVVDPLTLLPLAGDFLIDNGAAYTNQPTVTLAFSVQNVAKVMVSEDPTFGAGATWTAYAGNVSFVMSNGDGTKTVYAKFQDLFGNVTAVKSQSIALDTTPPSSPSLTIDAGGAFTVSPLVNLALSANGADQVHLWGDVNDTGWVPYAGSRADNLLGGLGPKTIAVQYRDLAGNLSATATANITYTSPPTVYGVVTLSGLTNHAGVRVSLQGPSFSALTMSAPDGSFAFAGVATAGTYQLVYSMSNFEGTSLTVPVTIGSDTDASPLVLTASTGGISGTAGLQGGADPSGITMTLSGISAIGAPVTLATFTDAAGNYGFPGVLVGSGYSVRAAKPNYVSATLSGVTVVRNTTSALSPLTLSQDLSGSVTGYAYLAGATGSGNSGITVTLSGTNVYGTTFTTSQTTSGQGFYTLSNVPGGNYVLTFSSSNYDSTSAGMGLLAGQGVQGPSATLSPSKGNISGTVALQGVANASGVLITVAGISAIGQSVTASATTNAGGAYSLNGILVGTYFINASMPNYVSQTLSSQVVSADQTLTATFGTLPVDNGSISGLAVVSLGPCAAQPSSAGIAVGVSGTTFQGNLFTNSGTTLSNGGYAFGNVPPGTYQLLASDANYAGASTSNVVVTAGSPATAGTIQLVDAVAPSAPQITTPTSITNASSYSLQAVAATDASGNLAGYQKLGGSYSTWTNASATEVAALTFNFTLNLNQNNTLQLRATDCAGNAGPADFLNVTQDNTPPAAPTNVKVENRDGRVDLSWTPSSSPDTQGYLLYYGPINSANPADYNGTFASEGASPIDVGNAARISLTGIQDMTGFYVALKAYDRLPNLSSLTTPVAANPSLYPLNFVANVSPGSVGLSGSMRGVVLATDYAYVSVNNGVAILDVGVPTAAWKVGFLSAGTAQAWGLAVSYPLVLVNLNDSGTSNNELRIFNVATPTNPVQVGGVFTYHGSDCCTADGTPLAVQWPFAYLPGWGAAGVVVVNVANPSAPAVVTGYNPGGVSTVTDLQVFGRYLYTMNFGGGIAISDVSNPAAPVLVGGPVGAAAFSMAFAWPYAFSLSSFDFTAYNLQATTAPSVVANVALPSFSGLGRMTAVGPLVVEGHGNAINVWNTADPSNAAIVASIPNRAAAGMAVRGSQLAVAVGSQGLDLYTLSPQPPVAALQGSYTAGSYYGDGTRPWYRMADVHDANYGLRILDAASNPSVVTVQQSYALPLGMGGIYTDRTTAYAYVAGICCGSPPSATLRTIEISNPANPSPPQQVLTLGPGCSTLYGCDCTPFGVDVQGGFAYVANQSAGIRVVDVRSPLAPRLVGSYDTPDCAVWSRAYGSRLYVADRSSVIVLNISDPSNPVLLASRPMSNVGFVTPAAGRLYVSGLAGLASAVTNISPTTVTILRGDTLAPLGSVDLGEITTGVEVQWPYAYVGGGSSNRLWILDVSNDAKPQPIAHLDSLSTTMPILEGAFLYGNSWNSFDLAQLK